MIPTNQTLQTGPNPRAAIILTQLDCLIHPPVPITQIGWERRPEMNVETFFGAGERVMLVTPTQKNKGRVEAYNPIARA